MLAHQAQIRKECIVAALHAVQIARSVVFECRGVGFLLVELGDEFAAALYFVAQVFWHKYTRLEHIPFLAGLIFRQFLLVECDDIFKCET